MTGLNAFGIFNQTAIQQLRYEDMEDMTEYVFQATTGSNWRRNTELVISVSCLAYHNNVEFIPFCHVPILHKFLSAA